MGVRDMTVTASDLFCGAGGTSTGLHRAAAKTGDPAIAAYSICQDCGSSRKWAEAVIAKTEGTT